MRVHTGCRGPSRTQASVAAAARAARTPPAATGAARPKRATDAANSGPAMLAMPTDAPISATADARRSTAVSAMHAVAAGWMLPASKP